MCVFVCVMVAWRSCMSLARIGEAVIHAAIIHAAMDGAIERASLNASIHNLSDDNHKLPVNSVHSWLITITTKCLQMAGSNLDHKQYHIFHMK